jgi:hypothetical protein
MRHDLIGAEDPEPRAVKAEAMEEESGRDTPQEMYGDVDAWKAREDVERARGE